MAVVLDVKVWWSWSCMESKDVVQAQPLSVRAARWASSLVLLVAASARTVHRASTATTLAQPSRKRSDECHVIAIKENC